MAVKSIICLLVLFHHGTDVSPNQQERIIKALQRSTQFLERDARLWLDGKLPVQHKGCVSCHQVPTGVWSLTAAERALDRQPGKAFQSLFSNAVEFADDKEVGRPAIWSQLLISDLISRSGETTNLPERYLPLVLESQNENGSWSAKGQFPFQRREVQESDAVVTMWMLRAFQLAGNNTKQVSTARDRALGFVNLQTGDSTEFLAWRLMTRDPASERHMADKSRLLAAQNSDGSWGWKASETGNAYSTGVALFALLSKGKPSANTDRAIEYLLHNQMPDGTWHLDSGLISKEGPTDNLNYIYQYWATAWATIGLAQVIDE